MADNSQTDDQTRNETVVQLPYLPVGRANEVNQIFSDLGMECLKPYPGALEFSKHLQKASALQFEGIIFTTSSGAICTPK